jgi:hypothetical protein
LNSSPLVLLKFDVGETPENPTKRECRWNQKQPDEFGHVGFEQAGEELNFD